MEPLQFTVASPGGCGQWNPCCTLPHCRGAVGSGTPAAHCLTAGGLWAVEPLLHTASLPGGGGQWNSGGTLPHCLGGAVQWWCGVEWCGAVRCKGARQQISEHKPSLYQETWYNTALNRQHLARSHSHAKHRGALSVTPPPTPCVKVRLFAVSFRGIGQSPILPGFYTVGRYCLIGVGMEGLGLHISFLSLHVLWPIFPVLVRLAHTAPLLC